MPDFIRSTLGGDKSEYVNPCIPTQTPEEDYLAICNHQADNPRFVWPDVWSGDMQTYKTVWSYMTPNVLCWDQVS